MENIVRNALLNPTKSPAKAAKRIRVGNKLLANIIQIKLSCKKIQKRISITMSNINPIAIKGWLNESAMEMRFDNPDVSLPNFVRPSTPPALFKENNFPVVFSTFSLIPLISKLWSIFTPYSIFILVSDNYTYKCP